MILIDSWLLNYEWLSTFFEFIFVNINSIILQSWAFSANPWQSSFNLLIHLDIDYHSFILRKGAWK